MGTAFRVLWLSIKDYYEEMFTLAGASLVWMLLAIPLITLPPATAGILYLTNQVAHHKSIEFGMFFQGFKKFFLKSWLLVLINVAVGIIFYTNLRFYAQYDAQWSVIVRGLFVGLFALWCLIQIYVLPMLFEQEQPKLLLALRNAAFLTFATPITSLFLGILIVVVAILSSVLVILLPFAMMGVIGLMANHAVLTLLVQLGIRKPPEEVVE